MKCQSLFSAKAYFLQKISKVFLLKFEPSMISMIRAAPCKKVSPGIYGQWRPRFSLCICTVWSDPLPFINRIIEYYRMYEWRTQVWMILCTYVGWSESVHLALVRSHLLDAAHTLVLLNPDIHCLCKQCRSRSVGF